MTSVCFLHFDFRGLKGNGLQVHRNYCASKEVWGDCEENQEGGCAVSTLDKSFGMPLGIFSVMQVFADLTLSTFLGNHAVLGLQHCKSNTTWNARLYL